MIRVSNDRLETSQERKEELKAEGLVDLANSTSLEEETLVRLYMSYCVPTVL